MSDPRYPALYQINARVWLTGKDLQARGLYLDEPPWRAHVFLLTKRDAVRSREQRFVLDPKGIENGLR
jgi:hypothetical protein